MKNLFSSIRNLLKEKHKYKKVVLGGSILVGVSMGANVLNFFYNAYLGRVLSLSDFALISLISGLLSFTSTMTSPFNAAVNYKASLLIGESGSQKAYAFFLALRKKTGIISVILAAIWLASNHALLQYFPNGTPLLFAMFTFIILVGLGDGANRGFLSAQLMFASVAIVNLVDPIIRIITAVVLVHLSLDDLTYIAIPLGIIGSYLVGTYLVKRQQVTVEKNMSTTVTSFPVKFYIATLLTGISSIVFLSVDILLANHYLNAEDAGSYGLLTLIAKMIYFLAALITPFTIPLLGRLEGANKNSRIALYSLMAGNFLAAGSGYILFGLLGSWTLPIMYGEKVARILPYVIFFGFGMLCFTLSKVLVNYYLIKKVYFATLVTVLLAIFQIVLISLFHSSVQAIALDMTVVWVLNLVFMLIVHLFASKIIRLEHRTKDFIFGKKVAAEIIPMLTEKKSATTRFPVTVAIPVLNEAGNIKRLLKSVVAQKETGYFIKEILVLSDGSTDNTVQEAQKINDKRIKIIVSKKREGKAQRLNELFMKARSEYVILLDADVVMNTTTLSNLMQGFTVVPKIGLVSGKAVPVQGKTFIEKSINSSIYAYHALVDKVNNGNNLYAVEGRILALKRAVGFAIPLPPRSIATDAFLYFSAIKQGYHFQYAPKAIVYFTSPQTLKEHLHQNKRFVARKYTLKKYFGSVVDKEAKIPFLIYVQVMSKHFSADPIHAFSIFLINVYTKYLAKHDLATITGMWPLAVSTKKAIAKK